MCKDKCADGTCKGAPLDTSGLVAHSPKTGRSVYQKRQIAKAITIAQLLPLIDLDSPLKKSYWKTWHCNNVLRFQDGSITSEYCDHRWCTLCSRIRMAKMIEGYSVPLLTLNDLHFVTLTDVNVFGESLKGEIDVFMLRWRKIRKHMSKYGQRIRGMRKLEVTYKPSTGYNPHFHLLISGRSVAEDIVSQWLRHSKTAKRNAQDIRKADDGSLIELFKYVSKGVHKGKYYPAAIDWMYQCLRNRKTFYPIGIKKYVEEDISGIRSQEVDFIDDEGQMLVFQWDNSSHAWYDQYHRSLTNVILDGKLIDWINSLESTDNAAA